MQLEALSEFGTTWSDALVLMQRQKRRKLSGFSAVTRQGRLNNHCFLGKGILRPRCGGGLRTTGLVYQGDVWYEVAEKSGVELAQVSVTHKAVTTAP
jgi:hypothetical protein